MELDYTTQGDFRAKYRGGYISVPTKDGSVQTLYVSDVLMRGEAQSEDDKIVASIVGDKDKTSEWPQTNIKISALNISGMTARFPERESVNTPMGVACILSRAQSGTLPKRIPVPGENITISYIDGVESILERGSEHYHIDFGSYSRIMDNFYKENRRSYEESVSLIRTGRVLSCSISKNIILKLSANSRSILVYYLTLPIGTIDDSQPFKASYNLMWEEFTRQRGNAYG